VERRKEENMQHGQITVHVEKEEKFSELKKRLNKK
jgi:hypothetical protein